MTWKGKVTKGVVVVEDGADLPEGAEVRIQLRRQTTLAVRSLRRTLLRHAGKGRGLPPDLAENHDHYAHGRPEKG